MRKPFAATADASAHTLIIQYRTQILSASTDTPSYVLMRWIFVLGAGGGRVKLRHMNVDSRTLEVRVECRHLIPSGVVFVFAKTHTLKPSPTLMNVFGRRSISINDNLDYTLHTHISMVYRWGSSVRSEWGVRWIDCGLVVIPGKLAKWSARGWVVEGDAFRHPTNRMIA